VAIARVAERQHTVVSLTELKALGLGKAAAAKRAASGRLRRIHRGVYAVGHGRLTREGHWMAAVLACGPKAVLSHRSAAALWGLRSDNRAKTDVSVPSRSARSRPGIDVHRSMTLAPSDCTTHDGIPCTTVARTLLDLAEVLNRRGLERAIERAEVLRLFDLRAVQDVLARANGRRGAAVLRAVLARLGEPALTEHELEERFLGLCRIARLPTPEVNAWLDIDDDPAVKADFLWRRERVIVETDGYETHGTRQAFERDRLRDQRLKRAGYEPLRFTWRQVAERPGWVSETVAALVARGAVGAR
jgi:very-short-patch-repair endonuclease/predicted transcriptional regulator of viral defense system